MTPAAGYRGYPSDNALNLVRLALAATVIVAHAYYVLGVGNGPVIRGENIGGYAVFGFFAISGYLVTHSRLARPLGQYLVHRAARLLPAFWVCLLVMVVGFGPLGYFVENATLDGYFSTATQPLRYLTSNWLLDVTSYDIAGSPRSVPYPGVWNGSIWTLWYEFVCYLLIAALLSLAVARRRAWLVVGAAWAAATATHWLWSHGLARFVGDDGQIANLLKLAPIFLGGALLRLLPWRVRYRWWIAVPSLGVFVAAVWLTGTTGAQVTAPLLAYVLLWLGLVVPRVAWFQRNDLSYGVYIYAFPVQQTLVLLGVAGTSVVSHSVAALALVVPFALASWFLVERPVMRRSRASDARPKPTDEPVVTQGGAANDRGLQRDAVPVER